MSGYPAPGGGGPPEQASEELIYNSAALWRGRRAGHGLQVTGHREQGTGDTYN